MGVADRPRVVCLCGSTRFRQAFDLANMHESLAGRIVISLGTWGHADHPEGARFLTSDGDESTPEKRALDELHFRKIDLADEILVINVGGYVGSSTQREIAYAHETRKRVRWLFPEEADDKWEYSRSELLDRHRDVLREAVSRLRPMIRCGDADEALKQIEWIQRLRPEDLAAAGDVAEQTVSA